MVGADDGSLLVDTVAKFVFCPRAGIIAHELTATSRPDVPPTQFNLDYVPRFHLSGIEEALGRLTASLTKWGVAGGVTLVVTAVMFLLGFLVLMVPFGIAVIAISWIAAKRINRIAEADEWRSAAREALPKEPAPTVERHQQVNWWETLAAGFESVPGREDYRDDELGIYGRPWRVLRKGSLRIPVIKLSADDAGEAPPPHHAVLVAAYCRLLKLSEGMESPYSILLFGESWEGLAVANSEALQGLLQEAVQLARELVRAAERPEFAPPPPSLPLACLRCEYGRPVVYRIERGSPWWGDEGRVTGVPRAGRVFHSCCGDRFGWTPPHEQALALKLTD